MLLTKQIEVCVTAKNVNHYKSKGYNIPTKYSEKSNQIIIDSSTPMVVNVEDLPSGSSTKICYKCDECGNTFSTAWNIWNKRKFQELGDMCKNCAAKKKLPKAMLDKYGYTNSANVPTIIEKKKCTNLKRYGNEWSIASTSVRQNIEETFLEKFGAKTPMKNFDVKQKLKNTNNVRYGGNSPMCSPTVQVKSKETCMNKYGVPNAYQSKDIQAKAKASLYKNNTVPSSKAEIKMCQLLKQIFGENNCFPSFLEGALILDCLVLVDGCKIDFEYDGCYWHKGKEQKDAARNAVLMNMGYKIIRIKANNQDILPTIEQIKNAVNYLVKGNHHLVFIKIND